MLVENSLAKKTAKNRKKDARQKTSPLVDLGLVDDDRQLLSVGNELLRLNETKNF